MHKITRKQKLATAAAGTVAAVVAVSGVAYAYWTSTGSGSDSSTSTTAAAGTVTYHSTFDAASLVPGASVSVDYSASNATSTDLSVAAPAATVSSDKTYKDADNNVQSCAAFLSLSAQPTAGVVPHKSGDTDGSASLGSASLSMDNSLTLNQDSCQGQTVTIALSNS